jgi:hypothetical protein
VVNPANRSSLDRYRVFSYNASVNEKDEDPRMEDRGLGIEMVERHAAMLNLLFFRLPSSNF